MPTTITIGESLNPVQVLGKSVSQQDESNYLACRSGSGEGGGTEGSSGGGTAMNIGIRSEKTKVSLSIARSYTIMRHILSFLIADTLPANSQITEASVTLVSAGFTQDLELGSDSFSYATSSVSVVAGERTGLVNTGDYDSVNITDGTGDLTDRGMTFRTYDDIDSGSFVPTTSGQTVTIPLNQNAMDDLASVASGSSFDMGIINTKFDKGGTVAAPGSFLTATEPHNLFTGAGATSHDGAGTDIHHEGCFIFTFGEFGYGFTSRQPKLSYTYKIQESAGKVTFVNKIVHASGKISHTDKLV